MAVKETSCTRCKHLHVCKFKEEFLDAQNAVENTTIVVKQTDPTGKEQIHTRYISDIDYIEPIKLRCKHAEYIPVSQTRCDPGVSSMGSDQNVSFF
jgi:hypothetical protein